MLGAERSTFECMPTKDAGIVSESFWNETNQVIWDFCFCKTNPWNKSFKNRYTNRIHETNPLNTVGWNKSTKQIFWKQYGFANPKPRIHMDSGLFKVCLCTKDLSGFVGFLKTGPIFWKSVYLLNPWIESLKIGFINHVTKRTFLESGFVITIWKNPWIRKTNPCFYESLIQFPHP